MIKQTVMAASVFAAAVFAFQPQQAQAGTKVQVHIGVPSLGYFGGHHYYGGHRPHYRNHAYQGRPVYRPRRSYRKVGCNQAKQVLHNRGFRDVRTRDCHGSLYVFKAFRGGHWWMVRVSSQTGQVLGARAI